MSIDVNYKKLFRPYTGDGHTLDASMRYWTKCAADKGISPSIVELSVNEVFGELAIGTEFPKDICPCGCGIDKAATALIHEVRDRIFSIDKDRQEAETELIERRFNTILQGQMRRIAMEDRRHYKATRPPLSERSPILRAINSLRGKGGA